jgi:predicted nucleotidyltransferase
MRLSPEHQAIIRRAVARTFGPQGEIWVFGSRVDDSALGGDLDLYVEADGDPGDILDRELRLYAELQRELGEQRIDIVTRRRSSPERPIHREAKRMGVRL